MAMPARLMIFDVSPSCFMPMNETSIETGSGSVTMRMLRNTLPFLLPNAGDHLVKLLRHGFPRVVLVWKPIVPQPERLRFDSPGQRPGLQLEVTLAL